MLWLMIAPSGGYLALEGIASRVYRQDGRVLKEASRDVPLRHGHIAFSSAGVGHKRPGTGMAPRHAGISSFRLHFEADRGQRRKARRCDRKNRNRMDRARSGAWKATPASSSSALPERWCGGAYP